MIKHQIKFPFARRPHILTVEPTRDNLEYRCMRELQALCQVLVVPHTGTKAILIERILLVWDLRQTLKDIQTPDELTTRFKGKELKAMCRTARLFCSAGKKYHHAASLLNWRNACRNKGQQRINEARAQQGKSNIELLPVKV